MASIYQLKPKFQALLRPIVRGLARSGITANQVTIAALLMSCAAGALLIACPDRRALLVLPIVLFIRMALNAIDGMLAREHAQASKLGAILNELGDVLADAALYLPLALRAEFPPVLIVVLVMLAIVVEMTGVIGVQIGASRRYDGPFGKSDRAFVFGALGLALALGAPPGAWLTWLLWILVAFSAVTIVNRSRRALAEIAAKGGAWTFISGFSRTRCGHSAPSSRYCSSRP